MLRAGHKRSVNNAACFTGLDPDSHTSQLAAEKLPFQRLPWLLLLSWILPKQEQKSRFPLKPCAIPSVAGDRQLNPRQPVQRREKCYLQSKDEPTHRWYEA